MFGVNVAFGVQALLCLAATIIAITMVKNRAEDAKASDPENERRDVIEAIMHRDVFMVSSDATVADNGRLVGVINRSDITQYALKTYLDRRDVEAVAALEESAK